MTNTVKKLAAVFLAVAMIVTFVPVFATQTAYADDETTITSITLESKGDLTIPTAGDPITYPDIAKATSTVPAGHESEIDFKYCWHDVTNNNDYFQSEGSTGVFTAGSWQLVIIVYPPDGYTLDRPFTYPIPLGGYDFVYDYGGSNYFRIGTSITIPDNPDYGAPAIPSDNLSGRYDTGNSLNKNIGALGSKPMTYSVTSGALPDGITLGEDGSVTGTFTSGGTFDFTITVANNLGSESRDYTIVVNSVTRITDFTVNSTGEPLTPKAGMVISYPDFLNISATTPAGFEEVLDLDYAWYNDASNYIYFSSSGDTGIFTPGSWHFGFIVSIPSDKRIELKLDNLPRCVEIEGTIYDKYSETSGYVIYRTPCTIAETPITEVSIADIASKTYTGSPIKPVPAIKFGENALTEGIDYTISYKNNTNVGTATVTITGIGNYTGTVKKTFKITAKKITPTVTLSVSSYTWDGKVKKPTVTVKDGSTKLAASQYTVTYKNNINVGKASAIVTLKGNYSGSKTKTFKINPKGTSLKTLTKASKAVTVKWTEQASKMSSSRITGYQIQLATDKNFTKNKKLVTVKGYSKVSKKVTGLMGGKKYYVRIRTYKTVSGTNYYSLWSKAQTVTTKK